MEVPSREELQARKTPSREELQVMRIAREEEMKEVARREEDCSDEDCLTPSREELQARVDKLSAYLESCQRINPGKSPGIF